MIMNAKTDKEQKEKKPKENNNELLAPKKYEVDITTELYGKIGTQKYFFYTLEEADDFSWLEKCKTRKGKLKKIVLKINKKWKELKKNNNE